MGRYGGNDVSKAENALLLNTGHQCPYTPPLEGVADDSLLAGARGRLSPSYYKLRHKAYRDGIVGTKNGQISETVAAVLGHTAMADRVRSDKNYETVMKGIIGGNQNIKKELDMFLITGLRYRLCLQPMIMQRIQHL